MKQWSIVLYPFEEEKPHPVVILSTDEFCKNEAYAYVNGLICTSVQDNRLPKRREIFLDESDGLDRKTAVRCDFIHALPKAKFKELRGSVSAVRQKQLARKIAEVLRFSLY